MTPSVQDLLNDAASAARRGDPRAAAALLEQAVEHSLARHQPVAVSVYFELAKALHQTGRSEAAEQRLRQALARQPNHFTLNNLLGVVLKHQGRYTEALEALARAEKAAPRNTAPLVNRGNVYLAMGAGARAVEVFRRLVRAEPHESEHLRLLGVACRLSGEFEQALKQFELARRLAPGDERGWLDAAMLLRDLGRHAEAIDTVERGLASAREKRGLEIAKGQLLRAAGRHDEAKAYFAGMIERQPDHAAAHFQLGRTVAPFDRAAANAHFREAVRLAPLNLDYSVELADSLNRTRTGAEGANIQQAYELAMRIVQRGGPLQPHARALGGILERCADHVTAHRLGDFETLGRYWAVANQPAALHHQLARVSTGQDRRLLVEHHRLWGRRTDAIAERSPLRRTAPAQPHQRIRVGFMSSDLRSHPVSYFALPILEGYDRSRFEVFCYSWNTHAPDRVQEHIARSVDTFRCAPGISARDAAQLIADDGLDILFELGGTTDMNKLEVMAWRPARCSVSWLGYPHSAGLGRSTTS
jgi:protein O-GlcNAc transferase